MARFYFHVVVSERVDDLVGHDPPGPHEAVQEGKRCVREITTLFAAAGVDVSEYRLEIESGAGVLMLVIPFGINGRVLAPSRGTPRNGRTIDPIRAASTDGAVDVGQVLRGLDIVLSSGAYDPIVLRREIELVAQRLRLEGCCELAVARLRNYARRLI